MALWIYSSMARVITVILILVVATHYHRGSYPAFSWLVKNNGVAVAISGSSAEPLSFTEIEMNTTKYIKDEKSFFNLSPTTTSPDDDGVHGSPRAYNTLKIL